MLSLAVDNSSPAADAEQRRKLIAKVHVARKATGMDEDDYRVLLSRVTGEHSAKDCDNRQLASVVAEFERLGFQRGRARRAPASGAVARKARAMWISLHQLGAIDDPSEKALEAFGRRQLRVERLQWANERLGYRLIEALKAIAERHGWDQNVSSHLTAPERIHLLKDRLVGAQLARLTAAGHPMAGPLAADRGGWSEKRLESAAAELGTILRTVPKPP